MLLPLSHNPAPEVVLKCSRGLPPALLAGKPDVPELTLPAILGNMAANPFAFSPTPSFYGHMMGFAISHVWGRAYFEPEVRISDLCFAPSGPSPPVYVFFLHQVKAPREQPLHQLFTVASQSVR